MRNRSEARLAGLEDWQFLRHNLWRVIFRQAGLGCASHIPLMIYYRREVGSVIGQAVAANEHLFCPLPFTEAPSGLPENGCIFIRTLHLSIVSNYKLISSRYRNKREAF